VPVLRMRVDILVDPAMKWWCIATEGESTRSMRWDPRRYRLRMILSLLMTGVRERMDPGPQASFKDAALPIFSPHTYRHLPFFIPELSF